MSRLPWPVYPSRTGRFDYRVLIAPLRYPDTRTRARQLLIGAAVYLTGVLFVPLPWVAQEPPAKTTERGWPLLLISDVVTGASLERGTLLASGLWVILVGRAVKFLRPLPQFHSVVGWFFLSVLVAIVTAHYWQSQGRLQQNGLRFAGTVALLMFGASIIGSYRSTITLRSI